jgi:membrane protein
MAWPLTDLLRETFSEAGKDNIPRLGAALAFYTALSLSPLLLLLVAIVGFVVPDRGAVTEQLIGEVRQVAGAAGASVAEALLKAPKSTAGGVGATIAGLIALAFGATGVFAELQGSLDVIWNTSTPRAGGVWGYVKARLLSLSMIGGMAFLVLVSLFASAGIEACTEALNRFLPGMAGLLQLANTLLSFGLALVLFAMIFRILPNCEVPWSDVWLGAALTAVLFTLGKYALGAYLGHAAIGSSYGPAGSFVVLLVWVYYSAQILLLGAEFTEVYSRRRGSRCEPGKRAPETAHAA